MSTSTSTSAPTQVFRFQLVMWPVDPRRYKPTDPVPPTTERSSLRTTAAGFFATDRWREHENVRERFTVTIPAGWKGAIALGLVAIDETGKKATGDRPTPRLTTRNSSSWACSRSRGKLSSFGGVRTS